MAHQLHNMDSTCIHIVRNYVVGVVGVGSDFWVWIAAPHSCVIKLARMNITGWSFLCYILHEQYSFFSVLTWLSVNWNIISAISHYHLAPLNWVCLSHFPCKVKNLSLQRPRVSYSWLKHINYIWAGFWVYGYSIWSINVIIVIWAAAVTYMFYAECAFCSDHNPNLSK